VRGDTVSTVVGLRNVPEAIRSRGALANPDYVDLCTVTLAGTSPASYSHSETNPLPCLVPGI
jgi:hypothetical protein